jgi:hypothetical protein
VEKIIHVPVINTDKFKLFREKVVPVEKIVEKAVPV